MTSPPPAYQQLPQRIALTGFSFLAVGAVVRFVFAPQGSGSMPEAMMGVGAFTLAIGLVWLAVRAGRGRRERGRTHDCTLEELFRGADASLYRAKEAGRNRVGS